MAVIPTINGLETVARSWMPSMLRSSVRLYDNYAYDYGTIYRTQPNVRTCVDFLARNIAHLGLHVFRRLDDGDRQRLRDHPLAQTIARPLPPEYKVSTYRLIESLVADLGVYFNAYWLKVRTGDRLGLLRIPPYMVTVEGALYAQVYKIDMGGKQLSYAPDTVVHFRGYNPESASFGLSPLETLRRILAEEHAAGDYREHFWANAARMHGVIERPMDAPEWGQEARERFLADFASMYAGSEGSGQTAVLEEGMSWKQAEFAPQDAEYLSGRKLTREECARAYHIPPPLVGILDHATFCLPAETLVTTLRGPIPIANVEAGDWVWSLDSEREGIGLFRVAARKLTGQLPLLTIRTGNRTIRCTGNHPLLRRTRRQISETEFGNRKRYSHSLEWIRADKLLPGDILVTLSELPDVGSDVCPTRRVSEGFAEFCGLLLGDGCISKTRTLGNPTGVRIARAAAAPYMDHYREVMRAEFRQRDGEITLDEQERETRFASVAAARELVALGFDGGAHTKRVPEWVFGLNRRLRAAFLRGYLDADGSVDKKGRISFSSCNEEMLRQVRELCIGIGVPVTNVRCQRGETTLPTGVRTPFEQWTFTCSDPGANWKRIGSHDPRYRVRMDRGRPFGRYYEYPDRTGRIGVEPPAGCGYARILQIEEGCAEPVLVYDLEIEDAHNFIAEGLVVHNSNIKEQHKSLYTDTLGPWLGMIEQDVDLQLVPEFEDVDGVYVEFNVMEKLQGDFEEQTIALQSAVGRPWMTPNEARGRLNMQRLEGDADELATPLNVLIGGQASPRDSAPPVTATAARKDADGLKADGDGAPTGALDSTLIERRERYVEQWRQLLIRHFGRQRDALVARLIDNGELDALWQGERWDRELSDDLFKLNVATAAAWGRYVAEQLESVLDEARMYAWLKENARIAAEEINASTYEQIAQALRAPEMADAIKNVFTLAESSRAQMLAESRVTTASNFGAQEAAKQGGIKTKTWVVNSGNPRSMHAVMNGETVPIGTRFSNGMQCPGDPAGGVENNSNCRCSLRFGR